MGLPPLFRKEARCQMRSVIGCSCSRALSSMGFQGNSQEVLTYRPAIQVYLPVPRIPAVFEEYSRNAWRISSIAACTASESPPGESWALLLQSNSKDISSPLFISNNRICQTPAAKAETDSTTAAAITNTNRLRFPPAFTPIKHPVRISSSSDPSETHNFPATQRVSNCASSNSFRSNSSILLHLQQFSALFPGPAEPHPHRSRRSSHNRAISSVVKFS